MSGVMVDMERVNKKLRLLHKLGKELLGSAKKNRNEGSTMMYNGFIYGIERAQEEMAKLEILEEGAHRNDRKEG